MARFLLVGLTTDGPSCQPTLLTVDQAFQQFGGQHIERNSLSNSGSSITLDFTPWETPHDYVGGLGSKQLYFPSFVDNILTFGSIGGSAAIYTVDLSYTPYLGKSDLLAALSFYSQNQTDLPYISRIGGTVATATVSGWSFEARYPGSKYNAVSITFSTSSVTISGMAPEFAAIRYDSTNAYQTYQAIQQDYSQGRSPVSVTQWSTNLVAGSAFLTGGSDGSFSDADIEEFLATAVIPLDCTHVVFLTPMTSGMIDSVDNTLFDNGQQPRLFLAAAPDYTGDINTYVALLNSQVPQRHNMVASVLGTVSATIRGRLYDRYAVEAVAASYPSSDEFGMTNLPLKVVAFTPELSAADLLTAKAAGVMPLMRYIRSGVAVYQSTTSTGDQPFVYSSKLAELWAACRQITEPYIGTILPDGPQPQIAADLRRSIEQVRHIKITSVECVVQSGLSLKQFSIGSRSEVVVGSLMEVSVEGVIFDEILSIQFFVTVL